MTCDQPIYSRDVTNEEEGELKTFYIILREPFLPKGPRPIFHHIEEFAPISQNWRVTLSKD